MKIEVKLTFGRSEGKRYAALFALLFILSVLFLELVFPGYAAVKVYYLLIAPLSFTGTALLLGKSIAALKSLVRNERNGALVLIGLLFAFAVAVLPVLTQSYLFVDELWMYQGDETADILDGLPYGRLLSFFVFYIYRGVQWANSSDVRLIAACVAALCIIFIFTWCYRCTQNLVFSFVLTMLTCVTSSMMDMVSFSGHQIWGLLFSCVSPCAFHEAVQYFSENKKLSAFWLCVSVSTLILGFNCYPTSTPIIFFLLGIYVMKKQWGKDLFLYLAVYAGVFLVSALLFLASIKFYSARYGIIGQIATRGTMSLTPAFLWEKLKWFTSEVLPQGIYRIADAFSFGKVTDRNNLLYATDIIKGLGAATCIFFLAVVGIGGALFLKRRKKEGIPLCVLELLFLFLSFYPFFLLPESSYLSYYAYSCFCMLCLLFCGSLWEIFLSIGESSRQRMQKPVIVVLTLLIALEFNVYTNIAWVQFNAIPFTVAKTELMNQYATLVEKKRVYVTGAAEPVEVDIYSVNLIQQVLLDLGENPAEYTITCTLNGAYSTGIVEWTFEAVADQVSPEKRALLYECYTKDPHYQTYWVNTEVVTEEKGQMLSEIFKETGLIPSQEDAAYVDLRSINQWRSL